jgi:hypothetical protein
LAARRYWVGVTSIGIARCASRTGVDNAVSTVLSAAGTTFVRGGFSRLIGDSPR